MAKPVIVKRKIEIIMDEDGITFKFLEEARNRTGRENIKDVIRDGIDFYDLILWVNRQNSRLKSDKCGIIQR